MKTIGERLLVVALCAAAAACSGGSGSVEAERRSATSAVRLEVSGAPPEVARVVATVSAPDMAPVLAELSNAGGTWSAVVPQLPAGLDRVASLEAFDASGLPTHVGRAAGIAIAAGQLASVVVILQPLVPPTPPFYNTPPFISAVIVSANPVEAKQTVTLAVDAFDPDAGDSLSYTWWASDGLLSGPLASTTSWTAPGYEGPQFFGVEVRDSRGAVAEFWFSLFVSLPRPFGELYVAAAFVEWPVVADVSAYPTRIPPMPGAHVGLSATVHSPDGAPLALRWSSDCVGSFSDPLAPSTGFVLEQVPPAGRCVFTVSAGDPVGASAFGSVVVHVAPEPPVLVGGGGAPGPIVPVSGTLPCTTASSNTGRKAAVDAAGIVHVGMLCGGSAFVATSRDGGASFEPPRRLDFPSVGELALQGAEPGVAHAVGISEGRTWITTTLDAGTTWSPPLPLGLDTWSIQASVAVLGNTVLVYDGVRLYRSAAGPFGPFEPLEVALPTAFGDVLVDPASGAVWLASDTPDFHLRRSLDGGQTFEPELAPPGIAYYSDWALGNGFIFGIGSEPHVLYRIDPRAPLFALEVGGFVDTAPGVTRALAASPAGDAYVVSQSSVGVALQRVPFGAPIAEPPRLLAPDGVAPGVVAGPGSSAIVVFTRGETVYASVQTY